MNNDQTYMDIAISEAKLAFGDGNLPIGAVLTIDGHVLAKGRNNSLQNRSWANHAENVLIIDNSSIIRESVKKKGLEFCLYTTLEPCLMCFGTAVLHRVSRIVYACPDPVAGATSIGRMRMGLMYSENWPTIETGPCREEAYNLVIEFLSQKPHCNEMLSLYESRRREILGR